MINHERPFGLQTPSSDSVIIWSTQKMLITNRYSHRKDWTLMTNQLICLRVNFIIKIQLHLLLDRFSFFLLTCIFFICFIWLVLLLWFSWTLHLFLVLFIRLLIHCWLVLIFQIFFYLLSDHFIHRQDIVLLFRKNENFDGAVRHPCCHDGSAVREADAV